MTNISKIDEPNDYDSLQDVVHKIYNKINEIIDRLNEEEIK